MTPDTCPDCPTQQPCGTDGCKMAIASLAAQIKAGVVPNTAPLYGRPDQELIEDIDYYVEKGNFVFKEWYHLKRGECCTNGCRHCPYRAATTDPTDDWY
jgi:hypothetical protein